MHASRSQTIVLTADTSTYPLSLLSCHSKWVMICILSLLQLLNFCQQSHFSFSSSRWYQVEKHFRLDIISKQPREDGMMASHPVNFSDGLVMVWRPAGIYMSIPQKTDDQSQSEKWLTMKMITRNLQEQDLTHPITNTKIRLKTTSHPAWNPPRPEPFSFSHRHLSADPDPTQDPQCLKTA